MWSTVLQALRLEQWAAPLAAGAAPPGAGAVPALPMQEEKLSMPLDPSEGLLRDRDPAYCLAIQCWIWMYQQWPSIWLKVERATDLDYYH